MTALAKRQRSKFGKKVDLRNRRPNDCGYFLRPPGEPTNTTVTVSGAKSGNGTYQNNYITALAMAIDAYSDDLPPSPPTNLLNVVQNNQTVPVIFLEYDSNKQLVPGQCVQVTNSSQSYFVMYLNFADLNQQQTLSPGQSVYFVTTGGDGSGTVLTTQPCSDSKLSSLLIRGNDITGCKAGSVWNGLVPVLILILILVLLAGFLTKK